MADRQVVRVLDEPAEKGLVAHGVDEPRHALRIAVNASNRPRAEVRPAVSAGDLQPVADVALGIGARQGLEVVADSDALPELAEIPGVQFLAQLGLADQDDLKELSLIGLEVGEEPHLFEELVVEILGLVDEQNDVASGFELLEKELVENLKACRSIPSSRREPELREDGANH